MSTENFVRLHSDVFCDVLAPHTLVDVASITDERIAYLESKVDGLVRDIENIIQIVIDSQSEAASREDLKKELMEVLNCRYF